MGVQAGGCSRTSPVCGQRGPPTIVEEHQPGASLPGPHYKIGLRIGSMLHAILIVPALVLGFLRAAGPGLMAPEADGVQVSALKGRGPLRPWRPEQGVFGAPGAKRHGEARHSWESTDQAQIGAPPRSPAASSGTLHEWTRPEPDVCSVPDVERQGRVGCWNKPCRAMSL